MQTRLKTLLASVILMAPLGSMPAQSAGSGGSDVPECKTGEVYDKAAGKCVVKQGGGAIDDDSLYDTGRKLALAGRYEEAISVLSLVEDKNDPKVLNYLGYSHRKLGRVTVGLGYYQEALRIDPDYTLVREYLGEAYLQQGDLVAALGQLNEIAKRCGTGCEEYADLQAHIEAYTKG